MLNFGPGNSLTQSLHKCPGEKLTQNLHSAFFLFLFFEFGNSPHYLKAFDSMNNGAKVNIEKLTQRHSKNFTILSESHDKSVRPKEQHKQGRSEIDRDCNNNNELQHFLKSPFAFLYI